MIDTNKVAKVDSTAREPDLPLNPDFKRLFESLPGLYLILTPDWRIVAASDAYANATFTRREDILGHHLFEVFPDNPDDPHASGVRNLADSLARVLKTRAADTMAVQRYAIRRQKETEGGFEERWWSPVNAPILGSDGEVQFIIHQVEDVTEFVRLKQRQSDQEKRQAEEAVRHANQSAVTELIESISDGFVALDREWRYLNINSAASKLLGKVPEELLGKMMWDVFPETLLFGKEYRRSMEERVPVRFEGFCPEPLNLWVEVRCHPSANGLNVFFTDISERKATEQWLRQLSRAVEQSPSLVIITDTKGTIEYINPKFTEVTGYSFDEAIGRSTNLLNSGELPREVYAELWKTIKTGGEWRGEFHNRKKNGELYWEAATICHITDEKGAITHFLAVKEDITERKNAQTALIEAKQSAEQANKAKDVFLATLSHELRTPLTPVLLTTSVLETDETLSADLREQFSLIRNNIELESRLIDDLLDITKIAHGKFSIRRQSINASDILSKTLEIVRADFLGKEITVQVDAAAHSTTVNADPVRLQQVFWNLLKNAVKFTPSGGNIFVRTFNPDPESLAIEIRDTGIGIAPELLNEVFQPFQQGEATGKPQYGGLGLGLSISKNIIEVLGGTITVASAGLNTGTAFTVHIPVYEGVHGAKTAPPSPIKSPHSPQRILLVEDHESTRTVLTRLLRKEGHCVEAVGSCAEALSAAHSQSASEPFEALVCDLGLPDGSGLDIVRNLKASTPGLAAIALSGYGTDDDIRRSREAGFDEHLVKPVAIQELRRALAA